MELENQDLYTYDDWSWTESLSDYPASSYTLKLYLKYSDSSSVVITASSDGNDHLFEYASSDSGALTPGEYRYQFVAVNKTTSKKITVDVGYKIILAGLEGATDTRSYWEKRLASLQTALETLGDKAYTSVSWNGKSTSYDRKKLIEAISYAEMRVQLERRAASGKSPRPKRKIKFIEAS